VRVAVIGDEDSFDDVWGARIHACSGNLKRVLSLSRADFDQVDIRRDISELAEIVQKERISILYFDQFLDNLATETDHYHAKQVRAAMAPLRTVAKEIGVTTIATMHPNKRAETFRQLVQGTSAFNAVARSSLYIADHPDKEDVRVIVTAKSNYGRVGHALEFSIHEYVDRPNGYKLTVPKALGFKESDVTLDELIEASGHGKPKTTKKAEIAGVISDFLADEQWHVASECYDLLRADGFADRTIREAMRQLGVEVKKSGYQQPNLWRLTRASAQA
jgi:hypothetical protein